MHTPILLSLIRRREGIHAWVSHSNEGEESPTVIIEPLDNLASATFSGRATLLADWQALGHSNDVRTVWPAFWRVFWATLSEPQDVAPTPMPQQVAPRARTTATAAHPRAFRGTRFQPSKPARALSDLRGWMAEDRLLDGFFARHDFVSQPALGPDGQPLPASLFNEHRPTVSALLDLRGPGDAHSMPTAFKRYFLWGLRTGAADDATVWLRLWRAFGAPSQGRLLALLARLCALDSSAYKWPEMALSLPAARQAGFLCCILKHRSYRLPVDRLNGEQLHAFNALSSDDGHFNACLDIALDNLNRGINIDYTLIGCQLPDDYRGSGVSTRYLRTTAGSTDVPVAGIERMLAAVGEAGTHWARSAWESCATQPGFARILRETSWESLSSEVADRWIALFKVTEWDYENPGLRAAQWRVRLAMFPELHRQLLALLPDRRERFVAILQDYATGWDDPVTLENSWPILLPLQVRLCGSQFPARATGDGVLSTIAVHLRSSSWQQLSGISDDIWLTIEQACRRNNDAALIRRGINGLTEIMPDIAIRALAEAPTQLMRSTALLGCLEYHSRRRLLVQALRTPWFATEWGTMPVLASCERILALCTEYGLDSPLPRRLREHFTGKSHLSDAQLVRHCSVTLSRLPSTQLAALEALAWRHIDGPFNLRKHSAGASHAVRLHASIDGGNKKTLRRFLRGFANGGKHDFLDHPLNRAWYARHPRVNAAIWGGSTLREFVANDTITIAIETNPMEILMLGTYVGSCLGLGGLCEYSSVACLVDANKQVAYARDATGRVVARQLLAIDECDRLVCFEVYPSTASASVQQAFRQFDAALARSLALETYRNDDIDPYEIEIILAVEWWDDGQWHAIGAQPSGKVPTI